jgi:hypothetical protein
MLKTPLEGDDDDHCSSSTMEILSTNEIEHDNVT